MIIHSACYHDDAFKFVAKLVLSLGLDDPQTVLLTSTASTEYLAERHLAVDIHGLIQALYDNEYTRKIMLDTINSLLIAVPKGYSTAKKEKQNDG